LRSSLQYEISSKFFKIHSDDFQMKETGRWVDLSSTMCVLFVHILQKILKSNQGEGETKEEL